MCTSCVVKSVCFDRRILWSTDYRSIVEKSWGNSLFLIGRALVFEGKRHARFCTTKWSKPILSLPSLLLWSTLLFAIFVSASQVTTNTRFCNKCLPWRASKIKTYIYRFELDEKKNICFLRTRREMQGQFCKWKNLDLFSESPQYSRPVTKSLGIHRKCKFFKYGNNSVK